MLVAQQLSDLYGRLGRGFWPGRGEDIGPGDIARAQPECRSKRFEPPS